MVYFLCVTMPWCCCRWFNVDCSQSEDLYFLNIAVAEENAARQAER